MIVAKSKSPIFNMENLRVDAVCPECNSRNTNVLDMTPDENGLVLRECYDCGKDYEVRAD